MPLKRLHGLALLGLLAAAALRADSPAVGTTGAAMLKLGSSARSESLGGAYVALADDAAGLDYNPAGMLSLYQSQAQFTHTLWFGNVFFDRLDLVNVVDPDLALGFGLTYVGLPQQKSTVATGTDDPNNALNNFRENGVFNPYDLAASMGLAWRPGFWGLRTGVRLLLTDEELAGHSAGGFGLDLGAQAALPWPGLQAGLAVRNLGPQLSLVAGKFGMPLVFAGGLTYSLWDRLVFSTELGLPNDNDFYAALGVEAAVNKSLYLRTGVRFDGIFNSYTAGVGFKLPSSDVDLTWEPLGELGQSIRVSLSLNWGGSLPLGEDIALLAPQALLLHGGSKDQSAIILRPQLRHPEEAKAWSVYIYGGSPPAAVKGFSGSGAPPRGLVWVGDTDNGGSVAGGDFQAILSVSLKSGEMLRSSYIKLAVDPPLPRPRLDPSAGSLAPGRPGTLIIPAQLNIAGQGHPIEHPLRWRLDIVDVQGQLFQRAEGSLPADAAFVWTGTNALGKNFYSNTVYRFTLSFLDDQGQVLASGAPLDLLCVFAR